MDMRRLVGQNLRRIREKKGLTQEVALGYAFAIKVAATI
jgi:transcriptional regulator with XRE-family HTH domain